MVFASEDTEERVHEVAAVPVVRVGHRSLSVCIVQGPEHLEIEYILLVTDKREKKPHARILFIHIFFAIMPSA